MAKPPPKEKKTTVFVPEGFADFQCACCGACCSDPPRLEISGAKTQRLVRLLQESGFPFPVRDAVMRDDDRPDAPARFALLGERCVFLSDDNRCHLVTMGAPELRGQWCITYPVTPLVTPRGVNYSISFACPTTSEMLRSKKPLHILALTIPGAPLPSPDRPFTARHRIPIARGRPRLDWAAHRLVEGMLLAIARDWRIDLTNRLAVMPIMVDHLLRDYRGPESDAALRERVSHAGQRLSQMIRKVRSFPPDPAAHYEALSAIFGRRIGLRTKTRLRKLVDEAVYQVRGRRTKTPVSELGQTTAALYARRYKPHADRFEHILGNYVICRLFANREMLTGGVYKGLYVLFYLVALVRFFATTTAAARNERVHEDLLLEAVRTVEKLFAHSRSVFDFLDGDDEQQRLPDPAYAAVLLRV